MAVEAAPKRLGVACTALLSTTSFLVATAWLAPPDLLRRAAFRLGIASLGPCAQPPLGLHLQRPSSTQHEFQSPRNSATCGGCFLVQEVAEWNVKALLKNRRSTAPKYASLAQKRRCNGTAQARLGRLGLQAAAPLSGPAHREGSVYRSWAEGVLHKVPMQASLTRPIVPSEPLFQSAGCPVMKQMHAFHCPLVEVGEASVDGATLRAASRGQPLDTLASAAGARHSALVLPFARRDHSIYHSFRLSRDSGSLWCVWQAAEELRAIGVPNLRLVLHGQHRRSLSNWEADLLHALIPFWSRDLQASQRPLQGDGIEAKASRAHDSNATEFARLFTFSRGSPSGWPSGGPAYQYLELDRMADPLQMRLTATVRRTLGVAPLPRAERVVLLLDRSRSRRLVGSRTLSFSELIDAMCALGLKLRVDTFEKLPFHRQVALAASAELMIGAHGSALTNLVWMHEGATVLEVILRYGWCCNPVPSEQRLAAGDVPRPRCRCSAYNKAEIPNMAHAFGLRWLYMDAVYIPPPQSQNPIDRTVVVVNALQLARAAEAIVTGSWETDPNFS